MRVERYGDERSSVWSRHGRQPAREDPGRRRPVPSRCDSSRMLRCRIWGPAGAERTPRDGKAHCTAAELPPRSSRGRATRHSQSLSGRIALIPDQPRNRPPPSGSQSWLNQSGASYLRSTHLSRATSSDQLPQPSCSSCAPVTSRRQGAGPGLSTRAQRAAHLRSPRSRHRTPGSRTRASHSHHYQEEWDRTSRQGTRRSGPVHRARFSIRDLSLKPSPPTRDPDQSPPRWGH
jgi:hypothetical protein